MYAIIAATGHLGSTALTYLLDSGVEPAQIRALVRNTAKAAPLAERGVDVRPFNFTDPSTMGPALDGVTRLLFVSSPAPQGREAEHRAVIDAAQAAGVQRLVYTSFVGTPERSDNPLTPDHTFTESLLANSDIPQIVVLRNGFYQENILGQLPQILDSGVLVGASGGGKISGASRLDLGEAAGRALTDAVQPGTYVLVGPSLTKSEFAAQIAEGSGTQVRYQEVPLEGYRTGMIEAGMPEGVAQVFTEVEKATASGAMESDSRDLATILGREPETVADTVRRLQA